MNGIITHIHVRTLFNFECPTFFKQDDSVSKKHFCFVISWHKSFKWGYSSVGRAPALQAGGHEFESHYLHHFCKMGIINLKRICTLKTV